MCKDLSLDSSDLHALYYAPLQCAVWPRNVLTDFEKIDKNCT